MNGQSENNAAIADAHDKDELNDLELESVSGGSRPTDRASPLIFLNFRGENPQDY
jgi:hypothetical protein